MNKDSILKDIYKYYSIYLENNIYTTKKESLRQNKINQKDIITGKIFYKDILNIALNYTIIDWTDYNSCCYEYKILLYKNQSILDDDIKLMKALKGVRKDLRIFISILEPYYYMFIEKTKYINKKWTFEIIKNDDTDNELIEKIALYLSNKGYHQLSDKDVTIIVPNIQTDFKELNKANVFDCLFTDLVTIEN